MAKNNNGKYEFSLRTIVLVVGLLLSVFGAGGAWVGQKSAVSQLRADVNGNSHTIAILQDRQHTTDIQLARLIDAVDRLSVCINKLEKRLDN
jgi:hypothetical protein